MIMISEVGPRDGVQSLDFLVDLDIKKRWIAAEAAAGVHEIEVGSFVNFKRLPQMQDTAALVEFALTIPG
ncbi:MAG: hydroxymethylglutaryl-CoA lyase, partial [Yoonia sp.]|nr:hydroxymethylglutaryl-CoA lyase [Yoonia sp.]